MLTTQRSTGVLLLMLQLAGGLGCDPYRPLVCESCSGGCSEGLICESGRCIAPGAMCGLQCTSLDPCLDTARECVAGACVLTCGPDKGCEHANDVCMDGRCVRRCGEIDPCGLVIEDARDGIVASDRVQVVATTFGAVGMELSNVLTFDPEHPSTLAIVLDRSDAISSGSPRPERFRFGWDLSRGMGDCAQTVLGRCPRTVYARFVDARGDILELAEAAVSVDRRAPKLRPESIRYTIVAPSDALIADPTTLTTRSTASIEVALDEPVEALSVKLSGEVDEAWKINPVTDTLFVLTTTIGVARPEGVHEVVLVATDRVGNSASLPLDLGPVGFVIDRTSPVAVRDAELTRNPRNQPSLIISAPAGAAEPYATVVAFDSRGQQVGRTRASAEGEVSSLVLDGEASGVVRIRTVDDAGNESPEALVLHERFVSAQAGTFEDQVSMAPIRGGETSVRSVDRLLTTTRESEAAASNGVLMYVEAPRKWAFRASYRRQKLVRRAAQAAAFDPLSGRVVAFGGLQRTRSGFEPSDEFVRFDHGEWQRITPDRPIRQRDVGASLIASPQQGGWLFASSGNYASGCSYYDEERGWRDVTPDDSVRCDIKALAYDSRRRRPVGITDRELFVWTGSEWLLHSRLGERLPSYSALVYDEGRDEFVAVGVFGDTVVFRPDGAIVPRRPSLPEEFQSGGLQGNALRPPVAYDAAREQVVVLVSEGSRATLWAMGADRWVALESDGPHPEARLGASLVFDPTRNHIVMSGGMDLSGHRFVPGTWAWTGTRWLSLQSSRRVPTARQRGPMVHERHTGRTILLGYHSTGPGDSRLRPPPTTWVWDGRRWWDTQSELPENSVKPVYHEGLQRVVALSGWGASTWEQTAWVPLSFNGTEAPSRDVARGAVGYDPRADEILVFGPHTDELWAFDESGWRQIPRREPWPPARVNGAFVYDASIDRMVLFGGGNRESLALNDMWRWDGTEFSQVTGDEAFPSALIEANPAGVTYDESRDSLVAVLRLDMYWFDRSSRRWRHQPFANPVDALGVPDRAHSLAYDVHRGELLVYGGLDRDTSKMTADLFRRPRDRGWERWRGYWPEPHPETAHTFVTTAAGDGLLVLTSDESNQVQAFRLTNRRVVDDVWHGPYADAIPSMPTAPVVARHADRNILVLFDGANDMTWIYDGETWVAGRRGGPSARVGHAMAYDAPNHRVLLFGGRSPSGDVLNDTWAWDGGWSLLSNANAPPARFDHAMAADPIGGRIILFGGEEGPGMPLSDTWVWDGSSWAQVSGTGPSARSEHGLTFDEGAGYVLLVGGTDRTGQPLSDTWAFDGSAWWMPDVEGEPTFESAVPRSLGYDPTTGDIVMLGLNWMDGAPTRRPGVLLRWDMAEAVRRNQIIRGIDVRTVAGGRSFSGFDEHDGVEVALYNAASGEFVRWGRNHASIDARTAIEVSVREGASEYLLNNRYIYIRVQTNGSQDGGRIRPAMALEAAELVLSYELGDQP